MNAGEAKAKQISGKPFKNENDFQHQTAPPSYYEAVCTQQCLMDRRDFGERNGFRMEAMRSSQHGQVFTIRPMVGLYSENLICPYCQEQIDTRVDYVTTAKTHFSAMICCAICWPCGWWPYLMKECHDAHHYCPKCRAFIGIHSP